MAARSIVASVPGGMVRVEESGLTERAREAIRQAAPPKSVAHSETAGTAFLIGLVGFIATVMNVGSIARGEADWVNYVGAVIGLGLLWLGVSMFRQRLGSTIGEFELLCPAFYVRSQGMGHVEVYPWGACLDVSFTEVKTKGVVYNHTVMRCHFEGGAVDFIAVLETPHRAHPAASPAFAPKIQLIEQARLALAQGRYAALPGADLFPSALP